MSTAPSVYGTPASVTMMNLALYGGDYVLSPAAFASQLGAANANLNTYANTMGAGFNTETTTQYATRVLGNMGVVAVPGTLVHVPAGTAHWFRFGKDGGQMLSVTGVGSRASSMFTDIDAVGSRDVEQLRNACERNGLQIL